MAVRIERTVCLGKCNNGPNLRFAGGEFWQNPSMDDVPTLLDEFEERAGKNDAGATLYAGACV
ncbi:MAG: (2Fe-2S) ferredoxin domain-containing protein [Pseudomonadota bacterium]|nr:(2Fe-2S) ferredoxin domain-containing protein [Pseudomonadota bacterium]MED5359275.1 (2Fe-2S) ferredoxin domain-containing protein [Pseudomonadota bacterium]